MKVRVPGPISPLSEREREVLLLAGEGMTYEQIGEQLCIEWHTVKNHLYNARQKLGAKSTADALLKLKRLEARGG